MLVVIPGLASCQQLRTLSLELPYRRHSTEMNSQFQEIEAFHLPILQVLRIRASEAHDASMVLRTLPMPGMVLDVASSASRTAEPRADPREIIAYHELIHRVTQFWRSCSPDSLYTGVLYLKGGRYSQETKFCMSSTPTFSNVSDIHQPFCSFTASHYGNSPVMDSIKTLIISGDKAGPVGLYKGEPDDGNIAQMNLDIVQVKDASTDAHVSLLAKWLRERKSQGKPVRSLQILKQGSAKVTQSFQDVGARLKKQKVIQEVELLV